MKKITLILFSLLSYQAVNAQCIQFDDCDMEIVCDESNNDEYLWSGNQFWNPVIQSHNLPEGETPLELKARLTCGSIHSVSWALYLDLDQDGIMESMLNSDHQISDGYFPVGNYLSPGGPSFGDSVKYDSRAVSTQDKYRFVMKKSLVGDSLVAQIGWTTENNPGSFVLAQLPSGVHRVEWTVTNGLEKETCVKIFEVVDCLSPSVTCKPSFESPIMPTGLITLWASDFLEAGTDNETPDHRLIYGVRKAGTGNGFPRDAQGDPITAVNFRCDEQGTNPLELWVEDLAGNADYCLTEAIITDMDSLCSEDSFINLLFCITRPCDDESVEEIDYELLGNPPSGSPSHINFLDSMGCFYYNGFIPLGSIISITPTKNDDPLNGVTIYDLVLIYAHILGLQPLPSPYDMIAADANKSGSITTFDIIELQKLIIGTYTELPNNTSWRFIDSDFVFPSSNNPFQTAFPETKSIVDIWAGADSSITFYGIKVGDVNCSAIPNPDFVPQPLPEKAATIRGKQKLTPGTVTSIQLSLNEANQWMGAQLALAFDPDVLRPVGQPGSSLPLNDFAFAVSDDVVKMAGLFNTFQLLPAGSPILTVNFEVLQAADLEEAVWLDTIELSSEVYDLDLEQFSLAANYKYAINQDDPVSPPIKKTPLLDPPVAYVYPNPAVGTVQFVTEVEGYLQIRNAQGYLMSTQRVSKGSNELDSGSWLPGMYSWQLVNGDQVLSGTLIRR